MSDDEKVARARVYLRMKHAANCPARNPKTLKVIPRGECIRGSDAALGDLLALAMAMGAMKAYTDVENLEHVSMYDEDDDPADTAALHTVIYLSAIEDEGEKAESHLQAIQRRIREAK